MELKLLELPMVKKHPRAILATLIGFFLILSYLAESHMTSAKNIVTSDQTVNLDIFIPDGFVLVPIEVQNLASLDSIVGQFGVVDLFKDGQASAIVQGVKIIRSPKDQLQFAILAPEEFSQKLVQNSDKPFIVVVQNPKQAKNRIQKPKIPNRIEWEN
jgi:hypothetical protein